ncbi:hypothetical protein DFAR_2210011 [Desulfarculales bacterium]
MSLLPESNMKLASGLANLLAMLKAGRRLPLGTDGCASNNDLDLFGEMDTMAKMSKAVYLDLERPSARTVLERASRRGSDVFGYLDLACSEPAPWPTSLTPTSPTWRSYTIPTAIWSTPPAALTSCAPSATARC